MQKEHPRLVCKECGASLIPGDAYWTCSNCGASYPSAPGLVRISPSPYYWGEIPQEAMRQVLTQARRSSWRDAVASAMANHGWKRAERSVFGSGRCDWFPEVPYRRGMCALDIGSGWGNLAFLLSQRVAEVYSLEGVVERADFQQIRRDQEQVDNLTVVNSDLTVLPFQSASFDLVVLNGVLEWMGLADLSRDPRQVQLSVLKRIWQLLKPGGYLYVGIENRVSVATIRGERDHSGIPYTSLLPRRLADFVMRLRRPLDHRTDNFRSDGYRTYTYTPRGYRKLMHEAGFPDVRLSWVRPSYNAPYQSARFDSAAALRFYARQEARRSSRGQVKRHVVNAISRCGLVEYLMPTISVVACATGEQPPTLLEEVCCAMRRHGYAVRAEESLRYTGTHQAMSARTKIVYILFEEHTEKPVLVAKFPRTRKSVEILQEEKHVFGQVAARWPKLNDMRGACYLEVDDFPVLCERFFDGATFHEHLLSPQAYDTVTDWLADFQATRSDDAQMLSIPGSAWAALEGLCAYDYVDQPAKDFLRRWGEAVSKSGDLQIRSVPVHGDFCSDNVLYADGELFVTDWEWVKSEGGPWEDFCTFLMSTGFNTAPNGSNKWRMPENLLASLQGQSAHSQFIRSASERFLQRADLSPDVLLAGFLTTLVGRVIRDFAQHGVSPDVSAHCRFLRLAAQAKTPLWECFACLLSPEKASRC